MGVTGAPPGRGSEARWLAARERNVNYNVAFSQSAAPPYSPTGACNRSSTWAAGHHHAGRPGIGRGAELVEIGWVDVGALPLELQPTRTGW